MGSKRRRPRRGTSSEKGATKFSVGVLFIHGIGRQKRGTTVRKGAEALQQWLCRWPAVKAADLRSCSTCSDHDSSTPDHLYLELTTEAPNGEARHCWLLAEAYWDESIAAPRPLAVAKWAAQVIPTVTLWNLLVLQLRPVHLHLNLRSLWVASYQPLLGLVGLVFRALVTWLLVVLALLLGLMSAVPFLRRRAGLFLSHYVGDSYALTQQPRSYQAMIDSVSADLCWLQGKCRRTVIVAHSQGSMIAHRVLAGNSDVYGYVGLG